MADLSQISESLSVGNKLEPLGHAQCKFEDMKHKRCGKVAAPGEEYCARHKDTAELDKKFQGEIRRLEIKAPPRLTENIRRALVDPDLFSLRPHIAVHTAMSLDLIKNLETGSSTAKIQEVRQRFVEFERAYDGSDDHMKDARVARAKTALKDSIFKMCDRKEMEREYREVSGATASLIKQEMMRLEKVKAWIPVGYFNTMVQNLIGALQANVKDPEVLAIIAGVLTDFIVAEGGSTTNPSDFQL